MAGGVNLWELTARVTADFSQLDRALLASEKQVTKFGQAHLQLENLFKKNAGLVKQAKDAETLGSRALSASKSIEQLARRLERSGASQAARDMRNLAREMDNARKASSSLFERMQQRVSTSGFTGLIPGLAQISQIIQGIPQIGQLAHAIISPMTDMAQEGVRLNMTLEQAEIGFTAVAGSAEKAHQHLLNLQAFGAASPFRFEGLLEAARLMTAMGFAIDEQIPKLRSWGNAIAAGGEISAEHVHRVVLAFGQMRMAGRVTAQDMNQLTNANIPGWELLAKSIGKSVAETRKLSEAGRLNGKVAIEAITAMMDIDPRFKGMMDKLQTTAAGRLSALQDAVQIAQGTATKGLTENLSKMMGDALQRQDLLPMMAAQINSVLTPISGLIETGVKTVLTPGITTGIVEGINAGKSMVKKALIDFAQDSIIGSVKGALGINSPSTEFIDLGINSAEGYRDGILFGLRSMSGEIAGGFDTLLNDLDGLLQSRRKRFVSGKEKSRANLDKLIAREPDFLPKLIAGAQARGMNPDHLLNVMAVETAGSFNPAAKNPTSSASGLIQFMAATAKDLGTTTAALRQMSATQQLDYVFKYFDQYIRRFGSLDTQGKVYAAVGAGRVTPTDEGVVMRRGDRGYAGNAPTWDRNMDGLIRQGEMAMAAVAKLGAGIDFTVNGQRVTQTNPVPVYIAAVSNATDNRIGGWLSVPKRPPRVTAQEGPLPQIDTSGTVVAEPELVSTTIGFDPSKLTVSLRPLSPLLVESAEAAARLRDAVKQTGDAAAVLGPGEWLKAMMQSTDDAEGRINKLASTLTGNIDRAITEGFRGGVKNGVSSFGLGILEMIKDRALDALQKRMADVLTGGLSGAGGLKGGGGWLSKILGIVIGGIAGGGITSGGVSTGGAGSAAGGLIGGHADGGYMKPFEWSWVGERGPELVRAGNKGATVYSNEDSVALAGPGGYGGMTLNIYAHDVQAAFSRETMTQAKSKLRKLQRGR